MNATAQFLNIMYAPRLYAHADHWPEPFSPAAGRLPASIANQRLIDVHQLETQLDFDLPGDPLLMRCLEHWERLPRICLLIGTHCLRDVLIRAPHYARLDSVCQQFLCLPIQSISNTNLHRFDRDVDWDDDTVRIGSGVEHLGALLHRLPFALRQRLPLLFSCDVADRVRQLSSNEVQHDRPTTEPNLTLFLLAVNYALLEPSILS